jgi:hypothetical protein
VQSWTPSDPAQPWGGDAEMIDALRAELPGVRIEHVEADFTERDALERLMDAAVERSVTSTRSSSTTPTRAPAAWGSSTPRRSNVAGKGALH